MAIVLPIVGQEISKANFGDPVATELNERGVIKWAAGSVNDQVIAQTPTDITGLTATWTAKPARIYRTIWTGTLQQNSSISNPQIIIASGTGATLTSFSHGMNAGVLAAVSIMWVETGLSGSVTRKIMGVTPYGTLVHIGSYGRLASFCVECIG